MFCPKCGVAEQSAETFCRSCGIFLPDLEKLKRSEQAPEMHIKANAVLSIMTIVASLAIVSMLVAAFYGRETPVVIYPAAGLLIAIAAWQVQTFWRTVLLRRQLKRDLPRYAENSHAKQITSLGNRRLTDVDFEDLVSAGTIRRTTRDLSGNRRSSP